jgi:hypothetical protein
MGGTLRLVAAQEHQGRVASIHRAAESLDILGNRASGIHDGSRKPWHKKSRGCVETPAPV